MEKEVTAGSEFRVNVDITRFGTSVVDVLIRITVNGKKVEFTREVSIAGQELGSEFFNKVFSDMGAKVTGEYTLEFTLTSTQYKEIVDAGIINDGETLVLNLDKTKDLQMGSGLDDGTTEPEKPTDPEVPAVIPVENISIKDQQTITHGGSSFKLSAEITPNNATDKSVTWSSSHPENVFVDSQGNVTIKEYTQEQIIITVSSNADKSKTDTWQFNMEKASVTGITVTSQAKIYKKGSNVTIDFTITPSHTTDTVVSYSTTDGKSGNITTTNPLAPHIGAFLFAFSYI